MWLVLDGEGSLSRQVYRGVREAIRAGRLAAGARVPATRALARDLRVARITVIQGYEQLLAEGWLETRRGAGTFVSAGAAVERPAAAAPPSLGVRVSPARPRLSAFGERVLETRGRPLLSAAISTRPTLPYDFRYGTPAILDLPTTAWQRCIGRALRRASVRAYDYGAPLGNPALREALAEYLARSRGVRCAPERLLVVSGSQQGLDLAARVMLEPGATALIEEPGYEGARTAFRAAGARVVGVPVDAEGLDVVAAEAAAAGAGGLGDVRALFTTPSHQYPLGAVLSLARRRALLDFATRHGALVIEDDYDGEFRFEGKPLETLHALDGGERVLYLGTLSKVLFPALRLGYLVLPDALVEPFLRARLVADGGLAMLEQVALAELIREGSFERHVRRSRARHLERRETLLAAAARHLGDAVEIVGSNAGLHVVAWLRDVEPAALRRLIDDAAARGIGLYSIHPYYETPPPRAGLVLGYAALTPEAIETGIERLGALLRGRP